MNSRFAFRVLVIAAIVLGITLAGLLGALYGRPDTVVVSTPSDPPTASATPTSSATPTPYVLPVMPTGIPNPTPQPAGLPPAKGSAKTNHIHVPWIVRRILR